MALTPGARVEFRIGLASGDTFEPIPRAAVQLQQFSPAVGDFVPLQESTTAPNGTVLFQISLPSEEGRYRYRASWRGDSTFRPDSSPEIRVDIARAAP